jgi:hypothetical protein
MAESNAVRTFGVVDPKSGKTTFTGLRENTLIRGGVEVVI